MTLKPRSTAGQKQTTTGEAPGMGRAKRNPVTPAEPQDDETEIEATTGKRRVIPWSEIRSTYEQSALPIAVISKAYAVRERAIYERAAKEGWASRRTQIPDRPLDRSVLVARLFHAVERQISEIERRFMDFSESGADERDARTLAALARTIELLIGLERQAKPDIAEAPEADIDEVRRDLARRIANMRGNWPD